MTTKEIIDSIKTEPFSAEKMEVYMNMVLTRLKNSRFLTMIELDDNMRTGLYGILMSYNLSFRECHSASWEWIEICESQDGPALNADEIKTHNFNSTKFNEAVEICREKQSAQKTENAPEPIEIKYGWLSPTGKFTESEWGTHEASAQDIVAGKKLTNEYYDFIKTLDANSISLCGDFLLKKKGYALIHDPYRNGIPNVMEPTRLTKRQKEFLFTYFHDIGCFQKADDYV